MSILKDTMEYKIIKRDLVPVFKLRGLTLSQFLELLRSFEAQWAR